MVIKSELEKPGSLYLTWTLKNFKDTKQIESVKHIARYNSI